MPSINGREYQLATLDVTLQGPSSTFTFESFRDVKYKTAVPKEFVRDKRGKIVGWVTKDEDNAGASIRVLQSEWFAFKAWALGQLPGIKIGLMQFSASLTYGETAADFATDTWEGVMFNEEARAVGNDQKEAEVELPLFIPTIHMAGGDFF